MLRRTFHYGFTATVIVGLVALFGVLSEMPRQPVDEPVHRGDMLKIPDPLKDFFRSGVLSSVVVEGDKVKANVGTPFFSLTEEFQDSVAGELLAFHSGTAFVTIIDGETGEVVGKYDQHGFEWR